MDTSPVPVSRKVIAEAGLEAPDGRPLHGYPLSVGLIAELEGALRSRLAPGSRQVPMPAAFVLWAAEHIRSKFPGGQLTWAFVFDGLGLRTDRDLAVNLVEGGLRWWHREVRISDAGLRMSLYSLMAEGGIPQALLVAQQGLYRRVVLGLLAEIEAEGGMQAAPFVERIVARWITLLPQTFQTTDFVRLLAELAMALIRLRSMLPEDLPEQAAERWLDSHHPGWAATLPLRMSPEIAEQLIRPALRSTRGVRIVAGGPLVVRELRRDQAGCWRWFLRLNEDGFLPDALLPGADGLRLRLLQVGEATETVDAPVYLAAPEQGGWRIRRFGHSGATLIPFAPRIPFILGAFADGRRKGEVVIAPAIPGPEEAPTLWRAADPVEGTAATRLVPQPGSGRARAPFLWILTSGSAVPAAGEGLSLEGPEAAADGQLWRVSGCGTLAVGTGHRFRIETAALDEAPEARLVPVGEILTGWRTEQDRGPVYRGRPRIFGEVGAAGLRLLSPNVLHIGAPGRRTLFGQTVEWLEKGETLARLRLIWVPLAARITVVEEAAGRLRLTAEGLPRGTRLTLRAGRAEARMDFLGEVGQVVLTVQGAPPGQLKLRLSDVGTGAALDLIAPWPARAGLILDPHGARLEQHWPIAFDSLRGWRALVPEGASGDLQLRLVGHSAIALPVAGEVPLYPYLPLVRAMLSQGGPDAQVNLSLIVNGVEGRRLEVRRYHDQAIVQGDLLRAGLARGANTMPDTSLAAQFERQPITLHAVNLKTPQTPIILVDTPGRDLRVLLGEAGGPWLIQTRLGDHIQRAVAWSPQPLPKSIRSVRIAAYADEWRRLVEAPDDAEWDRLWKIIVKLAEGGDAGIADQVQALGLAPAAAVALTLRVRETELAEALALDMAAPLFWPALPLMAFADAVRADYRRQVLRRQDLFDAKEAAEEAERAVGVRVAAILSLRSELAGHFGFALIQAGLPGLMVALGRNEVIPTMLFPNPAIALAELAQVAARRFDRLPNGVGGILPQHRPSGLTFNTYAQTVIDAPLVAAEFATGLRSAASVKQLLALINLRLVDPGYFDAALPAAIAFVMEKSNK